jgi:pimeloyl-ACP methyl ester carboxylesterase
MTEVGPARIHPYPDAGCMLAVQLCLKCEEEIMTDKSMARSIVLVHGAWHGGWCWRDVAPLLQKQGFAVFCPTLTGLGERGHLSTPVPTLETHINDVIREIEWNELHDVVLVGHSYAGMVVTGVADRLKDRITHIIYLDAAVPQDGDDFASWIPGQPPAAAEQRRGAYRGQSPDGIWLPPAPPQMVGVPADNADATSWLQRRLTPHPLQTWLEPVHLANGGTSGIPKTYVACTAPPTTMMGYPAQAEVAKKGGEWRYRGIACGHDMMVIKPQETSALILEAIREPVA